MFDEGGGGENDDDAGDKDWFGGKKETGKVPRGRPFTLDDLLFCKRGGGCVETEREKEEDRARPGREKASSWDGDAIAVEECCW